VEPEYLPRELCISTFQSSGMTTPDTSMAECGCCSEPLDGCIEECVVCGREVHRDCSDALTGNQNACTDCHDNGSAEQFLIDSEW